MCSAHRMHADAAVQILTRRDKALGEVIAEIIGRDPELHVLSQHRATRPYPKWAVPPLNDDAPFLVRFTGYRLGDVWLSRNVAYVDLSAVEADLGEKLEREEVHLGQIFVRPDIEKTEYELGIDKDDSEIHDMFRRWFPPYPDQFAWRRYVAGIGGKPMFAVIEALPVETWERFVHGAGEESAGE